MKYFVIFFALIGIAYFELIRPAFAHSVHCGISGCRVGAFGITDWHLAETAFDNTLYFSIILYGVIMIFCWLFLFKRRFVSIIDKK